MTSVPAGHEQYWCHHAFWSSSTEATILESSENFFSIMRVIFEHSPAGRGRPGWHVNFGKRRWPTGTSVTKFVKWGIVFLLWWPASSLVMSNTDATMLSGRPRPIRGFSKALRFFEYQFCSTSGEPIVDGDVGCHVGKWNIGSEILCQAPFSSQKRIWSETGVFELMHKATELNRILSRIVHTGKTVSKP